MSTLRTDAQDPKYRKRGRRVNRAHVKAYLKAVTR